MRQNEIVERVMDLLRRLGLLPPVVSVRPIRAPGVRRYGEPRWQ